MIEIFKQKYKAISNLYVDTIEGDSYVYPAPIKFCATIEDSEKGSKSQLTVGVTSYLDSILTLEYQFSLFFYLYSFDYVIRTVHLVGLNKLSTSSELYGSSGIFSFDSGNVLLNIQEEDTYGSYKKNLRAHQRTAG